MARSPAPAAGCGSAELRAAGCDVGELLAAGYGTSQLLAAGFSAQEVQVQAAGLDKARLRTPSRRVAAGAPAGKWPFRNPTRYEKLTLTKDGDIEDVLLGNVAGSTYS